MKEQLAKLIARFPDHERVIKALSESSAHFQDLLRDHHDIHTSLNAPDTADDPAKKSDLEARYRNIEEKLIRLIQGYPLA